MHILVESLISWNPQLQSDIFSIFLLNFLFIIFKLNILKKKNDMENVIILCPCALMW